MTQPERLQTYRIHFVVEPSNDRVAVLARDYLNQHKSESAYSALQAQSFLWSFFEPNFGGLLFNELIATGQLDLDRIFSRRELVRWGFSADELD